MAGRPTWSSKSSTTLLTTATTCGSRRPATFLGLPVWDVAAAHDIGINFSEEYRTFIHRVDPQIDSERAKVVTDLLFTGHVQSLALVDRPAAPRKTQNATGDNLETDGRLAVLVPR